MASYISLRDLKVLQCEIDYDKVSKLVQYICGLDGDQKEKQDEAMMIQLSVTINEKDGQACIVTGYNEYWATVVLCKMGILQEEKIRYSNAPADFTHVMNYEHGVKPDSEIVDPITKWAKEVLHRDVELQKAPEPQC